MSSVCGVCGSSQSKYRCTACDLRYCSIACFKSHKATHDESPVTSAKTAADPIPADAPKPRVVRQITAEGVSSHPRFQELLQQYPELRTQLQSVYDATQPPTADQEPTRNMSNTYSDRRKRQDQDRTRKEPRWTPHIGESRGLKVMRAMRCRSGEEGKAMEEFVKLIDELVQPEPEESKN
ncbi:hypothetical protein BDY21DRAFT_159179 [Lineolata rhizophorae]|uniref:HIT-type domain-containing protein n=1 Tax=Lineolata rhizophorae TaxID=578093 RepID=A0A6A6P9Q9_9PEZI|nr:hypothetical protein BDY21DRAFT_159179 [Lineolata rhizophorae]